MNTERDIGFWVLISVGILLTFLLIAGQTFSLISYDSAAALGLQESVEEISEVGVSFAKGFAFGDTVIYIPLLIAGIIGVLRRKKWGLYAMFGSLAITAYWPPVHLYAIYIGRDVIALHAEKYVSYSILLPLLTLYGLWGMWYLYQNHSTNTP